MRGAVIGCGFFGSIHLEAWRRIAGCEIACAVDPDIDKARRAAPNAYAAAEEMFSREKLDFVDIATRPDTHLELVKLAVRHGVPVSCQKPMAPSWADAVAMVEAAAEAEVRLFIHENWRWQPWNRVVRGHVRKGDIGEPVTYHLRMRRNDGGGVAPYPAQPYFREMPRLLVYESMLHPMDIGQFVFSPIREVYARLRRVNPRIAGEDQAIVVMTHDGDLTGCVDGHRFADLAKDSPPLGDGVFEGDAGVLTIAATGDVFLNGDLAWRNTVTAGYRGDSVRAACEHFVDCLRTGAAFETSGRDYLHLFAAVEAVYLSAAERRVVTVAEVVQKL